VISQKCQYGLRAVFELARRYGQGPTKIAEIAETQAIPARFLEVILSQLKQSGFVESRRGAAGGYELARSPSQLTVGEVIRFIEGPLGPVDCVTDGSADKCLLSGRCAFLPLWQRAQKALEDVYDSISFQNLVDEDKQRSEKYVPMYAI
jgi:Rrf2 family protein